MGNEPLFNLSATTGQGVNDLIKALMDFAASAFSGEPVIAVRERHVAALRQAASQLREALANSDELLAEGLRRAATSLARLTGRVDVEDVLDAIFRDFCIGK